METLSEAPGRRVIGALAPDPRRPECVRVIVQGRPLLTVARAEAEAEGLSPGQVLDDPRYLRLCQSADREAAYRTALRFLERRPFAARDLGRRLVLKGHPPEAAAAAVERARSAGLVDDVRYALHYVETRAARGRGSLRLRRDLLLLGVDRACIDAALQHHFGAEDSELPRVEALVRKRLAQLKGLPTPVLRRRILAFLARRGFAGHAVHGVVRALIR